MRELMLGLYSEITGPQRYALASLMNGGTGLHVFHSYGCVEPASRMYSGAASRPHAPLRRTGWPENAGHCQLLPTRRQGRSRY